MRIMMSRRRKRKLKKKIIFTIILLLFVGIGTSLYLNKDSISNLFNNKEVANPNNNDKLDKEEKPKEDEIYKINMLATGDALIHNAIYWEYTLGGKETGPYNFDGALDYVKDIVSKYDIAYYNQETPFAGGTPDGYPRFSTPTEFGDAMIKAGFNMISTATNHTIDKGEKGILNFYNYLKNKDGIIFNGIADSEDARKNYMIGEKNNITYTMLSYTTSTNGLPVPSGKDYLVNVYDENKAKEDIAAIRDKVDVLIVAMHWGVEYATNPNSNQQEIAKYLADLGVDIILGAHPHVLQPITWIDDTLVMYSLGNFISNQYGTDDYNKLVGFMATLDITKTITPEGDVDITIDNLGGELIFTKYNGNPITTANHNGHQVIPFSKMTDKVLSTFTHPIERDRLYEKYSNILESMGTDLNIAPLPSN